MNDKIVDRCTDPENCRRCSQDADTPHAGIARVRPGSDNHHAPKPEAQAAGEPVAWRFRHPVDGDVGSWKSVQDEPVGGTYMQSFIDEGCIIEYAYPRPTLSTPASHDAQQPVPDSSVNAALDAVVAEGENVRFYVEASMQDYDPQTRRLLAEEVVRTAIEAAQQPAVVGEWRATVDRIVPAMDEVPEKDDERCCEWAVWNDRERIRRELIALTPAVTPTYGPKPAVVGDAIRHLTKWLDAVECECEGGHRCGRDEVQRTRDQLAALTPAATPGERTFSDDLRDYGCAFSRDGKRIDPADVFISPDGSVHSAQKEGNGNG